MRPDLDARAVRETGAGRRQGAASREGAHALGESERPQGDDDVGARHQIELAREVRPAVVELLRRREIVGRGAAAGRRQKRAVEPLAVGGASGFGKTREPDRVQGAKEKGARLVSREDAAGSVSAVCGGREPHEKESRGRVAECGKRPGPVSIRSEAPRRVARGLFPPADEPGAAAAGDDRALDRAVPREEPSGGNTCP